MRVVLRGGAVVDGDGVRRADVVVEGDRIALVGEVDEVAGDRVVDCRGRYVLPGFVDAHAHIDGLLGDAAVSRALLRQGVTTVIAGQDGVSYAPGPGRYATEYFASINGPHPGYGGGGVASYLSGVDAMARINAAYLVPAGTVRWEVCGASSAAADVAQRAAMSALVEESMAAGAVGLSTGLDYVPGVFADTAEIAELCVPVARAGGVYVTHMRGGYEDNSAAGIAEITRIAEVSGVGVHVSHFHAQADIVIEQIEALRGVDAAATFDAYPYTRGCTLLAMLLLPPELSALTAQEASLALRDVDERLRLRREWFPRVERYPSLGRDWPAMITFAHIAAPEFAWAHGLTIREAADRISVDAIDLALDVLAGSRLQVNVVMAVRRARPIAELARIFAHPAHMGGSDGIFIGAHPHPRARGTFARYLREYVRETSTWSWPDAVRHLSEAAAVRFGLGRRGRVAAGWVADLIVVDPGRVADMAEYDEPLREAVGIDDVFVAGRQVLADGALTGETPGRGLRHERPQARETHV